MPLPSPPFPSLSAISHPTKVRWLLQEEGAPAPARGESGDHSAKYNTDERERGKCTEWAAAKPRNRATGKSTWAHLQCRIMVF